MRCRDLPLVSHVTHADPTPASASRHTVVAGLSAVMCMAALVLLTVGEGRRDNVRMD